MEDLVDELSSAMIDVDNQIQSTSNECNVDIDGIVDQTDAHMRSVRNHKPVARSASILIRSKLLILSDSESDESNCGINSKMSQLSARKGKRVNKKNNHLSKTLCPKDIDRISLQNPLHSSYTGKRKRSSTISETNQSLNPNLSVNGLQMDCDNDMTDDSSLSESSDECNSEINCDGDDEQSDFYEVMAKSNKTNQRQRHHNHMHTSRGIDFAVPSARNPFLTMGLSSPSSSSYSSSLTSANILWKRRRRMH